MTGLTTYTRSRLEVQVNMAASLGVWSPSRLKEELTALEFEDATD